MKKKLPPCGNKHCSCSTGIHEGLTFGSGKLDDYGYFSKPCRICAKDNDSKVLETIFNMMQQASKKIDPKTNKNATEEIEKYIEQADWLKIPSWPFDNLVEIH